MIKLDQHGISGALLKPYLSFANKKTGNIAPGISSKTHSQTYPII